MSKPLSPTPLRKGDTIGVVAPAGQLTDRSRFERGVAILRDMGFEVRYPRDLWPGTGYLADSDANRSKELHTTAVDSEIQAVMAARGGYGMIRLLEELDVESLTDDRKPIIGFSDISLLLNQLVKQTGSICFHGPVVTSLVDCSHDALERLYYCLTGRWMRTLDLPRLEVIRSSEEAMGILVGGNLSTLMTTLGTPYDQDWTGCVVLLEDIGEPLYRLDRMLTQLSLAGKFAGVHGILLGDFSSGPNQDPLEKLRYTEYIWQRVATLTRSADIPVWGNIPVGHCPDNLTIPLGATVSMDNSRGKLQFQ